MNNITYAVSVDVNNPIIPYNVYVASVLDSNVRYLEITLYQNGNIIALSNEATATASLVTDDVLVDDSVECTISNNIISVPLEDLQRHGNLDVQVTVTEGTKVLAIPFPIQVRVTPNIAENAQIDENSLGSYAEVVHEIAEARGTYTTLHDAITAKLDGKLTVKPIPEDGYDDCTESNTLYYGYAGGYYVYVLPVVVTGSSNQSQYKLRADNGLIECRTRHYSNGAWGSWDNWTPVGREGNIADGAVTWAKLAAALQTAINAKAPASTAYTFDSTTTNVVYNVANPKTIYTNAYVNGKSAFVLTTANNHYQIALCYDGSEYTRQLTGSGSTTYNPWLEVSDLKSAFNMLETYKADKEVSGNAVDYLALQKDSAINVETGKIITNASLANRAACGPLLATPLYKRIQTTSGLYLVRIYGKNEVVGSLTEITSDWSSYCDLSDNQYLYLYVVLRKADNSSVENDDLSEVLQIAYYTTTGHAKGVSEKLNGKYNVDAPTDTENMPAAHGSFNPDIGRPVTISTFNNRGYIDAFELLKNYMTLSCDSNYEFVLYGNDNGGASSFTQVSSWVKSYDLTTIEYKYLSVVLRKTDNSDISNVDLSEIVTLTKAIAFAPYLTESEIKAIVKSDEWAGKKILWLGTSIPEQGYPQIVGTQIGATVTNKAVGSSMMRIGLTTYDNSELGDDLGITGLSHLNVLRSLSMTQEERLRLFLCWTTADRKAFLIAKGYSAEEVADVIGYSEMMTGSFVEDDTDPYSGQIPAQKPQDVWAEDGARYKAMRQYSYGCCWDDSTNIESNVSVTTKVTGTITGKLKSYVSLNDWIFFDHFRNDATDATSELYLSIPTDKYDRHYAIGAFNYLLKQIYLINPNANVLIIGHYDNDDTRHQLGHVWQAQEKAANLWALPLYKLWDESGIRATMQFTTTGYWDPSHKWHNTGYDGTNSVMNNLEGLNENKQQINGIWYHDVSLRQKWMWDDTHPLTVDAKTHIANLIAAWLLNKSVDLVER